MVVLGIVLIALAVLVGLGIAVSPYTSTNLEVYGIDFGMAVPTVFFLGAAVGAICVIGLWLTKKGLGRGYRRHKEVRELRQRAAAVEEEQTTGTAADDRAVTVTDDRPVGERPVSERPVSERDPATADRDHLAGADHTVTEHRQPH